MITEAANRVDFLKKAGSEDYIRFRMGEIAETALAQKSVQRKEEIAKLEDRQKILYKRLREMDGSTEKRNHYLRSLMKCKKGMKLSADVLHTLNWIWGLAA